MDKALKVLFDTSVLVAAMVVPHPMHEAARPWLKRAKLGQLTFLVAAHTLAETYSVLTALPLQPRISPAVANQLLAENIKPHAHVVTLNAAEYWSVVNKMVTLGLSGGAIYDALIAKAAQKGGADRLLTFNGKDFSRIWPEGAELLITPTST